MTISYYIVARPYKFGTKPGKIYVNFNNLLSTRIHLAGNNAKVG